MKKLAQIAAGLFAVALFTGCQVTVLPNEPDVVVIEEPCYDGYWSGTTAQGYSFSFYVEDDYVTDLSIEYEVPCGGLYKKSTRALAKKGCYDCADRWQVDVSTGEFFIRFEDSDGYDHEISGYFSSTWNSYGELSVYSPYCRTTLTSTWDASRD